MNLRKVVKQLGAGPFAVACGELVESLTIPQYLRLHLADSLANGVKTRP